jgi:hypothetical protein
MSVMREAASNGARLSHPGSPASTTRPPQWDVREGPGRPFEEDELHSVFALTNEDLELVRTARTPRNRLGLALLLAWVRAERRAVSDPATLPSEVVAFVASQLGCSLEVLEGYGDRSRRDTRIAHLRSVCRYLESGTKCGRSRRQVLSV